ncbi:hypothetical protein [Methylobacterium gossipiicola]|uniref:Uncharacterized protein n=1 Tax=Methylobacterium gossipiicola TaxID=582675 RepID=A0A1I2V872_9HYPH|nr:hypothetical protein [Methylobacterium gossipiicola]SFG85300.1 hypothetical protein SAMN05192565_113119 [Methylobacterium gossipiicola]
MPTTREIGAAVFAALTDDDKVNLREAIEEAHKSEQGDGDDTWYIEISNAGFPIPGSRHEPVDDRDMIRACAMIERAHEMARGQAPMMALVDHDDVRAMIGGAFNWSEVARIEALFTQARGVRS